jgi:hypothetical protein
MRAISVYGAIALALGLVTQGAAAQGAGPGTGRVYGGAGVGETRFRNYCDQVQATPGFSGSCSQRDQGVKVYAGYKLNPYVGLQLGYTNFGEPKADGTLGGAPVAGRWEGYGVDLSAAVFLPLGDVELFAKGGAVGWEVKSSSLATASGKITQRGFSWTAGAGVNWWLIPNAGLSLQYDRFQDIGDSGVQPQLDIDLFSINVVGRF